MPTYRSDGFLSLFYPRLYTQLFVNTINLLCEEPTSLFFPSPLGRIIAPPRRFIPSNMRFAFCSHVGAELFCSLSSCAFRDLCVYLGTAGRVCVLLHLLIALSVCTLISAEKMCSSSLVSPHKVIKSLIVSIVSGSNGGVERAQALWAQAVVEV